MDSKTAEYFRARLAAPPESPLEATRRFLLRYCADKLSMQEVENDVARMMKVNTRTLIAGLLGIEGLLADPPKKEGTLAQLVSWEVGWVLADGSDAAVKSWLRDLADMLRRHLGDVVPPDRT